MDYVSKTVKCATCNIVICEVLAFIQNKLKVMDEQSLVQICESAFSTADVKEAKSLLFESLSKRPTKRKREGKTLRDLEDIICLFKETDPEEIPIFVARKLEKLPPVTFDHIDVTVLLKRIVLLEKNLQEFRHEYATKIDLNDRISEISKNLSFKFQERKVNMQKRATFKLFDSGPMALPTLSNDESIAVECYATNSPSRSLPQRTSPVSSPITRACEPTVNMNEITNVCERRQDTAPALSASKQTIESADKRMSFAEALQKDSHAIKIMTNDKWSIVQKKRSRKSKFISQKGSALVDMETNAFQFRAADIKVPLFISNVHKAVSEQDIINYIYEKTQERVTLSKIRMKYEKDYNAYKVFVTKCKIDTYLNDKLWPTGVSFRRFVQFPMKRRNNTEDSCTQRPTTPTR